MSSSEDDYMADTFVDAPPTIVLRPGLCHSHRAQHQLTIESRKRHHADQQRAQSRPAIRQLEREAREEGLQTALTADNKGFAMLARMGYKAGEALGKQTTSSSKAEAAGGIVEPIGIELKTDRGGLGRTVALQQLRQRRSELRREKLLKAAGDKGVEVTADEFRARLALKAQERQLESDLGKSQRACEKLDLGESITVPAMPWFWPTRVQPPTDDADPTDNDPAAEPDAKLRKLDDDDDVNDSDDAETGEPVTYQTSEQLGMLTAYLRTTYCYCHWCGTHYTNVEDLQQNCPGEMKDDH